MRFYYARFTASLLLTMGAGLVVGFLTDSLLLVAATGIIGYIGFRFGESYGKVE